VPHSSTDHRRAAVGALRLLLTAVLALGITVVGASAASAHGEEGVMEVLTAEVAAPMEVSVEVGVLYANDDDLAEEATVTVVATGADGTSVGPVDVPRREDAVYATTFAVPTAGSWSLAFTSTGPTATATAEVEVTEDVTTTAAPTTDSPSTAAPTTEPTDSATSDTAGSDGDGEQAAAGEDDEESNVLPLVIVALVVLAVGTALVLFARSRGARSPEDIA
jgi:hypothetical protein